MDFRVKDRKIEIKEVEGSSKLYLIREDDVNFLQRSGINVSCGDRVVINTDKKEYEIFLICEQIEMSLENFVSVLENKNSNHHFCKRKLYTITEIAESVGIKNRVRAFELLAKAGWLALVVDPLDSKCRYLPTPVGKHLFTVKKEGFNIKTGLLSDDFYSKDVVVKSRVYVKKGLADEVRRFLLERV